MTATNTPPALSDRLQSILVGLLVQVKDNTDEGLARELMRNGIAELRGLAEQATDANDPAALYRIDALAAQLLTDHTQREALAAQHGGVVGVRSGIAHLDETLNGFEAGKLYLLAAMPGSGKTTIALQWASTIAQAGYPAVYVSLENDAVDLARKTACRLGNVSYSAALKGKLDPQVWATAVMELETLGGRLYLSTPRAAMPDIASLLAEVTERAGQPPALLVIDYLQAFAKRAAARADAADVRERIDRLTPALRSLGEQYGCAVLAISSQNRAGYLAGGMASLKESGDLEYGADVTMILAKPTDAGVGAVGGGGKGALPPLMTSALTSLTPLTLTVDKNRQGLTGRPMTLALHGDRCCVMEVQQ